MRGLDFVKGCILFIVAGTALVLISLNGCGVPKDEDNAITVWHWMVDRDDALQTLARQYEEENGIKINLELYAPSDVYSQKIIAAAQSRILPDIYGILDTKSIFATFIESGYVADLTPAFRADNGAWEKVIFPRALAVNRFDADNAYGVPAGIYGVPIDVTNIQMLYNKELLKTAGISEPPQTFEDFIKVGRKLKAVGIPGLVSGWGELWLADCFASNYAFNIMGQEKVMATYRGEVPYTDPDWIKVFAVFDRLAEEEVVVEGIVSKSNKYAEQDFALERAAFSFNGSWCVNVYHDMNPDLEYGAMLPPRVNPDRPMKIWGGAGSSFVVNAASTKKDAAIAFLKWLTAKEQQAWLSKITRNLPANRAALAAIPDTLSSFAKAMDNTTHPTVWPLNEDPQVIEAFDKALQSILIGELTPEEAGARVQAVKVKIMKKKGN